MEAKMAVFYGDCKRLKGFTLVEAMIVVALAGLLIGLALPAYNNMLAKQRVRIGTEDLASFIKTAQSQAKNKQTNVFLSFKPGANWCYGLNDVSACDCSVNNSCMINGVQTVVRSTDYSGVPLSIAITGLTGAATNPSIQFEGIRGTVNNAGSVVVTATNFSSTTSVSVMGLVTICSDTITSFTSCTNP
jgi:type IV fimbrial biogenesis protein FimT